MPEPTMLPADRLKARFGDSIRGVRQAIGETTVEVAPEALRDAVRFLHDEPELRFDCLVDLCGVDYLGYGDDEWDTESVTFEGFSRGVEGEGPGRFTWENRPIGAGPEKRFAVVVHLLSIEHNKRI